MKVTAPLAAAMLMLAAPAFAHPGDHSQLSFPQLGGHLLEIDHLVFIALTIVVGVLAYRAGRRSAEKRSGR